MKTSQLNIRVDEATKQKLRLASIISGYTQGEIIRVSFDRWVEAREVLKEKIKKALTDYKSSERAVKDHG